MFFSYRKYSRQFVAGLNFVLAAAVLTACSDSATSPVPVPVVDHSVATVVIESTVPILFEGDTHLLQAVAKDAAGRVLNARAFTWTSENPSVATIDATGRISAVAVGRADIRVTSENASSVIPVTIVAAQVGSILVSPSFASIEIGETRQLQAIVKDVFGRVMPNRTVTWSVVGANSTITASGAITGRRNGRATINATVDDIVEVIEIDVVAGAPYAWDLLYHRFLAGVHEIFTQTLGTSTTPVRINAGTVSRAPSASPDGLRIAFSVSMTELGTGNRVDDIFAVDRSGLNMKQLTTMAGYEDAPVWSPDGTRIAFVHWEQLGRADLWIMNADGTNQMNLTGDTGGGVAPGSPAWSPDGSRSAYTQNTNDAQGTTAKIMTMRADGSDKREVTSSLTGFDSSPTWSSDGQRIAFRRYFGADADIAIVNANGGAVTRIPLAGLQSNPSWSPDGAYIAFQQIDGPLDNLYTMHADGSAVRLRTVNTAWGGGLGPKWIRRN